MKKSVCIVDFDYSVCGGVEKVTAALANALCEYYDVYVASICMEEEKESFPLDPRVRFFNICGRPDRLRYLKKKAKKPFTDFLKEHKMELVILQGNYTGFVIGTACAGRGTKMAFFDHGALMNQWDRKDIRYIRWRSSRKCDLVIALTEQSRRDYITRFRLPEKKVRCIYNWIDDSYPAPEKYDAGSKRIISAGRFTYEKGFDLLVKAFAPAAKKHPDWHLDIYGDGEERKKIEGLIEEYGAGGNIHLCGLVDDLCERYREYAFYVLPSYREGMPLVLLEAKYNRLPVISFDIDTGPREIIKDGENGMLIPPYDTDKMTDAVNRLIEDAGLRKSMSDHTADDMEKFSRETITGQWIKLIEEG